jgi:hypothetical protein
MQAERGVSLLGCLVRCFLHHVPGFYALIATQYECRNAIQAYFEFVDFHCLYRSLSMPILSRTRPTI